MANSEWRIASGEQRLGTDHRMSPTWRTKLFAIRHSLLAAFLRGFRQRGLGLSEGPIDPRRQCLEIGSLDGRAAPDAQAGRRIAMRRDVVGRALLLDARDEVLHEGPLRVDRE